MSTEPTTRTFTSTRIVAIALFTLVLAFAGCGRETERQVSAGTGEPVHVEEDKQVSGDLAAQLQGILDAAVESPKTYFPGTLLYVSQPELGSWAGASGERTIDPSAPMRPDSTFRAGSIMKPFIAVAVLQLAEEGKFALDDPLPDVLPHDVIAKVSEADRITVRMLLNHTSGIPEYNDPKFEAAVAADPHRIWQAEDFLDIAAEQPRQFEPGARHAYSNTDYNLLGLVIEEATGESWRAVVRERVIERLDLENTSLPEPGDVSIGTDGAHGYVMLGEELHDFTEVDPSMAGAAGGHALVTTTEDLGRFIDALLAGELFEQPETLDEMLTFVPGKNPEEGQVGYGLGIARYEWPGGIEVIGHLGGTAGYQGFVGRVPDQDVDIAMVITTSGDPTPVLFPALEVMVTESSSV